MNPYSATKKQLIGALREAIQTGFDPCGCECPEIDCGKDKIKMDCRLYKVWDCWEKYFIKKQTGVSK